MMLEAEKIEAAVQTLTERLGEGPEIALILGSGLSSFAQSLEESAEVSYSDIGYWPVSKVVGHPGTLVVGRLGGHRVAACAGRVHMYEGHSPQSVAFPVRVLRQWGAKILIVTNAAGGIREGFEAGDLMLIRDHINLQGSNPLTGPKEERLGEQFIDMTEAYDSGLREIAKGVAQSTSMKLEEGVYVAMPGPAYETPAEVQMVRTLGGDAVGMSTVPEVLAARELNMRVLGISCISNLAAGISKSPLSHEEVTETTQRVKETFQQFLTRVVAEI